MDVVVIVACVFWAIGLTWGAVMIYKSVKSGNDGRFD